MNQALHYLMGQLYDFMQTTQIMYEISTLLAKFPSSRKEKKNLTFSPINGVLNMHVDWIEWILSFNL